MSLFDADYLLRKLPENDEAAIELLSRIEAIYEENASIEGVLGTHNRIYYPVSKDCQRFFTEISINNPHLLEEFFSFEPTFPQLIDWATDIMSGVCVSDEY